MVDASNGAKAMYAAQTLLAPTFRPKLMQNTALPPAPRAPKTRETKSKRFGIVLEPSLHKAIEGHAALMGEEMSELARRALKNEIAGRSVVTAHTGLDEIRLERVGSAACGPFGEAVADPAPFVLSHDVADFLEAIPQKDKIYVAAGESMEGAGIANGAALLIRPYPGGARPPLSKVALIQIFDAENNAESTVKRVVRWGNTPDKIELEDGDGNPFEIPAHAVRVEAVGAVKGLISTFDS